MTKVHKTLLITSTTFILTSAYAVVQADGNSNLGTSGYPSHTCTKPVTQKPSGQETFENQDELDKYNRGVDIYNSELKKYAACIKKYIADSYKDIERIKEKTLSAVDEANKLK